MSIQQLISVSLLGIIIGTIAWLFGYFYGIKSGYQLGLLKEKILNSEIKIKHSEIVIKKYEQYRRDLHIDLECENCGHIEKNHYAYDDRNFWDNVVPNIKCSSCKKSSNDLGIVNEKIETIYPEGYQI